jgi:putative heme-binding domain-containing protein
LATKGKTSQGRLHALWSLRSQMDFSAHTRLIGESLRGDASPQVQAGAAALASDILEGESSPQTATLQHAILQAVEALRGKTSTSVGLTTALTTIQVKDSLTKPLLNLARVSGDDPWIKPMILHSAMNGDPLHIIMELANPRTSGHPRVNGVAIQNQALIFTLGEWIAGKGSITKIAEASKNVLSIEAGNNSDWPLMTSEGLAAFQNGFAKGSFLRGLTVSTFTADAEVTRAWKALAETASKTLQDSDKPTQTRIDALYLAWLQGFEEMMPIFDQLLTPEQPVELQLATLEALNSSKEPAVADVLIDAWPKLTPTLRDKTTTLLLSRTDRIAKLLDAIEAKKISPAQLSIAAKATLGRQKSPALAARIAQLIGDSSSTNRTEVINTYLVAMGLKERRLLAVADGKMPSLLAPDPARGAKIYENACRVCHKFADQGNDVGPHLGTIKGWTAEQLVTNILDPNREVSPNFALYLVETHDGRTLSGLIASETAGNLTLKRADGGTDTVLRSEIKSLTSPGISLMPEGLEAAITPQQMADLIQYLKAP